MKINVMAAYGQLGSRIMHELLKQGAEPDQLIASVRSPEKANFLAVKGIQIRQADYDNEATLIEAFKDTDILLLIPTFAHSEARIMQYANAIEAAKQNGVKRIVSAGFLSTSIESAFVVAPFLVYSETKIRQSGLDWTLVRDSLYLDAVAEAIPRMVKNGKWTLPAKDAKVSYISRDDLARAIAAVCLNEGHSKKTYILTGNKAYNLSEITEFISNVTGKKIIYETESFDDYLQRNIADGIPEQMVGLISTLYTAMDNDEFNVVTDHVEKITGQPPEHPEEYFRRTIKLED